MKGLKKMKITNKPLIIAGLTAAILGGGVYSHFPLDKAFAKSFTTEKSDGDGEVADDMEQTHQKVNSVNGEENDGDGEVADDKEQTQQQVSSDKGEKSDGDGEVADEVEQAQLAKKAKISQGKAEKAALTKVPGKVVNTEIEDEDGTVAYSVIVKNAKINKEVNIDATTGKVLKVENDDEGNGKETSHQEIGEKSDGDGEQADD